MTEEDRQKLGERIGDILLVTAETAAEQVAKLISGENRLAVLAKRNEDGDMVYELFVKPTATVVFEPVPEAAEMRRLIGLVDKRFGKDKARTIIENASETGKRMKDISHLPAVVAQITLDCQTVLGDWRLTPEELTAAARDSMDRNDQP